MNPSNFRRPDATKNGLFSMAFDRWEIFTENKPLSKISYFCDLIFCCIFLLPKISFFFIFSCFALAIENKISLFSVAFRWRSKIRLDYFQWLGKVEKHIDKKKQCMSLNNYQHKKACAYIPAHSLYGEGRAL
jgi:hypothetical protein